MRQNSTFFTNELSEEVYGNTYRFQGDETLKGDKDINDTHHRVAQNLASIENEFDYWTDKFMKVLDGFTFMPGGRITANAGTGLEGTTYINCFVDGFMGKDQDSLEGIFDALRRQGLILKSEGGYGFNSDVLRPRGAYIKGIATESPGSVEMLDMWDTQSAVITKGSGKKAEKGKVKIRKGAQMVTKSVWHPDIEEFITAKQTEGKLTKFNMSVLCDDDFMNAVENHQPWQLKFPDYETCKDLYEAEWDGNIYLWESKGYPVRIYKTYEDANELFELITKSTYNRNEPGILFVTIINKLNNLWYIEYINATNPCITGRMIVATDKGLKRMSELKVGDKVWVAKDKFETIEKFYDVGEREVFQLITERGYCIEGTCDHKICVEDELIPISELTVGDYINCQTEGYLPEGGDYDEGYLAGVVFGDGWVVKSTGQIGISGCLEDKKEMGKICSYINKVFNCKLNVKKYKQRSGNYVLRISSTNKQLFTFAQNCKNIDWCILHKKEWLRGFISGWLFADGHLEKSNSNNIALSSSNKDYLDVFSSILLQFGILISNVYEVKRTGHDLDEFYSISSNNSYRVQITGESKHLLQKEIPLTGSIARNLHFKVSSNSRKATSFQKIVKVKKIGKEKVYDFKSNGKKLFYANGIQNFDCGEQLLPIGAVCLLGSLNLTQFVTADGAFDWIKFQQFIPIAVRMLDNVNDITYVPLPEQKQNLQDKRRIGLGIMGYGSLLLMLKIRYGSEEALKFSEQLMSCLANSAYAASAGLAVEKGAFPLFDAEKFLQSNYVKNVLTKETQDLIRKYGLRNSHLLSIQPTGNGGVFANMVSGGGEPVFAFDFVRTVIQPYAPEGLDTPKHVDFVNKTFESSTNWKWKKEGDESLLWTEFKSQTWKFDKPRGLLKESLVEDYGVWWLRQKDEWDPEADWAVSAEQLTVDDHVKTMEVLARYLDSAMSKTVNLPKDYPYEDFKQLYFKCWKTGVIKGCTTYREGTMTTVLSKAETKEIAEAFGFEYREPIRRPEELPCEIFHVKAKGKKWVVIVGLYDSKPYEVFALSNEMNLGIDNWKKGIMVKQKKNEYDLVSADRIAKFKSITQGCGDEEEALTRVISIALRYGSPIDAVIKQLGKAHGTVVSFSKAIARVLLKYATKIKEEENKIEKLCEKGGCKVVHEEGCVKCLTCGFSACK